MSWSELSQPANWTGPAFYLLRLVDAEGRPIAIPTLLGADPAGVVNIGETRQFEERRSDLVSGVTRCYGHSAGNLFRYVLLFTRLESAYPGCRLQYRFRATDSKAQAKALEASALKEYIIRFAQMPLLNRQLPKAYDDETWNALWDVLHGEGGTAELLLG